MISMPGEGDLLIMCRHARCACQFICAISASPCCACATVASVCVWRCVWTDITLCVNEDTSCRTYPHAPAPSTPHSPIGPEVTRVVLLHPHVILMKFPRTYVHGLTPSTPHSHTVPEWPRVPASAAVPICSALVHGASPSGLQPAVPLKVVARPRYCRPCPFRVYEAHFISHGDCAAACEYASYEAHFISHGDCAAACEYASYEAHFISHGDCAAACEYASSQTMTGGSGADHGAGDVTAGEPMELGGADPPTRQLIPRAKLRRVRSAASSQTRPPPQESGLTQANDDSGRELTSRCANCVVAPVRSPVLTPRTTLSLSPLDGDRFRCVWVEFRFKFPIVFRHFEQSILGPYLGPTSEDCEAFHGDHKIARLPRRNGVTSGLPLCTLRKAQLTSQILLKIGERVSPEPPCGARYVLQTRTTRDSPRKQETTTREQSRHPLPYCMTVGRGSGPDEQHVNAYRSSCTAQFRVKSWCIITATRRCSLETAGQLSRNTVRSAGESIGSSNACSDWRPPNERVNVFQRGDSVVVLPTSERQQFNILLQNQAYSRIEMDWRPPNERVNVFQRGDSVVVLPTSERQQFNILLQNQAYFRIEMGKFTEELQSFVKAVHDKDAVDLESETSEDVKNETLTCKMQDPCKLCIDCAYKLKPTKTRIRSYLTNENLEAIVIMQCERGETDL
ncbi:hypothetical protein PR048_007485 [Dryococelus australis]|uniref:Uncharacterized protein n=1 Tax=Dryococelus australis TaxID=614101 RepID=A0ABQ9HUC7_9NEOP|nr:hypothetical protein PR048_007485 [Dryococelus australis]